MAVRWYPSDPWTAWPGMGLARGFNEYTGEGSPADGPALYARPRALAPPEQAEARPARASDGES